jgi:hypothetical protein
MLSQKEIIKNVIMMLKKYLLTSVTGNESSAIQFTYNEQIE